MARWCTLGLAAAVLVFAAPASAATVRAGDNVLTYVAGPGETNGVVVEPSPGRNGFYDVRDTGATIDPGPGCTRISAGETTCEVGTDLRFVALMVELGDGDDELTFRGPGLGEGTLAGGGTGNDTLRGGCQMSGGAGDDVLEGCDGRFGNLNGDAGDDTIRGGQAPETISGGGGRDTLSGGPGDDSIADRDGDAGVVDADVIDGGAGDDAVIYSDRTAAVSVDLSARGPAGQAGEGDTLTGIESVLGGAGDDRLVGTDGPNTLVGFGGSDSIEGGAGNDTIEGGSGADTLSGGEGNDELLARDLFRDTASCGDGDDSLLGDRGDRVASSCERRALTRLELIPKRIGARRSGHARAALRCFAEDPGGPRSFGACDGTLTITARVRGRTVTVGRGACRRGDRCPSIYDVRLTRRGRALVRTRRALRVRVTFVRAPGTRAGALRHTETATLGASRRR